MFNFWKLMVKENNNYYTIKGLETCVCVPHVHTDQYHNLATLHTIFFSPMNMDQFVFLYFLTFKKNYKFFES